jgi:3-dehydroquinate dehydratase/shikimate dehydrogenase
MICVSIGRTRHKMMTAEHRALAERGAELVELRIDWLSHQPDLARLLKTRPAPCIVTCRRPQDGGRWKGSEDQRLALLRTALVSEVEYVDLEEDIAASIPRYADEKRIVSHHNFEQTPKDLEAIHERLCQLDPDIVKIVTMAHSPEDNVRMLKLVANAKVPTVGFCMGELGLVSRVLCGKYGSPFTFATFSRDRVLAPGQLSFDEMKDLYRFDDIDADTDVYGVIGDPIAHSLSPLLHNTAFHKAGIKAVYLPFRIPKFDLQKSLAHYEWLNVRGYSVTIPHKEGILDQAQQADESAKEIGAANTLFRSSEPGWQATNTDYPAALATIRLGLRSSQFTDDELEGRKVLILGAGGVARAIALGLVKAGALVTISNRTPERATELTGELGCQQLSWDHRGTGFADILVNCTSVGMHPNVDESPFVESQFRENMLVFDTVYNPENTLLLKQARERNCVTVSGIEMFIRQAALQFEQFTSCPAPLKTMRETLRQSISAVKS